MNDDILKLKNQVCFPLYAASRMVVAHYTPLLDALGLTYPQYLTMLLLWEHKTMGVKELGAHLYLDSGTLTPLLKRLESKGCVKRERSAFDGRMVNITLTAKGEKLKERAACVPLKVAQCMPLSQKESKTLYTLLYKLLSEQ